MKKTLILICLLISISYIVLAEQDENSFDFDVADYNDRQLMKIQEMVNDALGEFGEVFPSGMYECGIDIKEGSYIIKYLRYSDSCWAHEIYQETSFVFFNNMETYQKLLSGEVSVEEVGYDKCHEIKMNNGESHTIRLTTGNILFIGKGIFRIKANNGSWVP